MDQITDNGLIAACSVIGAAISVLTGMGVGLGQGFAAGKAAEAVGRQPEARGAIMSTMIVGMAIQETSALYGLLVSILLLFANPFVK